MLVFVVAFILPVAAVVGAVKIRTRWRSPLASVVLGGVVLLAALVVVAWVAIATDVGDADGFVDCWPNCTALQEIVGAAVFWAPVLMAAIVVLSAAYLGVTSRREKRRLG